MSMNTQTSYLKAFLKGNSGLKSFGVSPTVMIKRKELKKQTRNQITVKTCEKISCVICNSVYLFHKNQAKTTFYEIKEKKPPEGTMWFGRRYDTNEHVEFICKGCVKHLIPCIMCGKTFQQNSITTAYNDPGLQKTVDICLLCYSYEACSGCGYLAGASPCRWCRHEM